MLRLLLVALSSTGQESITTGLKKDFFKTSRFVIILETQVLKKNLGLPLMIIFIFA